MALTFATCLGPEDLAWKTLYLVNSIHRNTSDPEIITFLAKEEREQVPGEVLEEIREKAELVEGKVPVEDYPISAKIEALRVASERSDREHLMLLDSDTAVIDDIEVPGDAELFLKPVDLSQYWSSIKSQDEWEELAERTGLSVPGRDVKTGVDGQNSYRYWNAGAVITRNNDLPEKWLELTRELHGDISHGFFTDQVALALLATDYEVEELDRSYNFPVPHFFRSPSNVKVIHYHGYHHLAKLNNTEIRGKLEGTGLLERLEHEKDLRFWKKISLSYLKTLKGRALGYG